MISLKPPIEPSLMRDDLDFPALLGRVALVHAEQIAGKQRRLVAAGPGADFENDVALVHGVFGNEREPQPLFELRAPRFKLGLFRFGDGSASPNRSTDRRSGS